VACSVQRSIILLPKFIASGGTGKSYYSSTVLRIVVGTEKAIRDYYWVLPFVECPPNYENLSTL
jgi:hypothetical protein